MLTQLLFVGRLLASSTSWCVCMYLYVLGFSKHPSLLKVGVSKSPLDRIRTLEKWHGECVSSVFYNMGKTYHRAEKLIHVLLEDSNVCVDGDGGTEFFNSDVVFDTVERVVDLCGGKVEDIKPPVTIRQIVKLKHEGWMMLIYNFLFVDNCPLSFRTGGIHIDLKYNVEKMYDSGYRSSLSIIDLFNYGYMPVVPNTVDSCILVTGWVDHITGEMNVTIRSKEWFETYFEKDILEGMPLYCELSTFYAKIYALDSV